MAAEFHTLEVASVEPLTEASVTIRFAVPPELSDAYRFVAGQHVIVRRDIDGEDVRRSYSVCASANSGDLRVAVKRLNGGAFSTYANTELGVGDRLDVTLPVGEFTIPTDPDHAKHYLAIAAGSGITPVMSMIATVLEDEPNSRFTLVYGNRNSMSVMFLDELGALKDRFTSRSHARAHSQQGGERHPASSTAASTSPSSRSSSPPSSMPTRSTAGTCAARPGWWKRHARP